MNKEIRNKMIEIKAEFRKICKQNGWRYRTGTIAWMARAYADAAKLNAQFNATFARHWLMSEMKRTGLLDIVFKELGK